jgi:Aerotolerance regulator N-terminal/von Willebrand factor type A domain
MSFIAPLFLIASLAILGPIIFHMIRRQAKGEQLFSSLMFLEPSPPTMMRRSRIDQWLLLLLRSLAVLLLVAAFARPFLPTFTLIESSKSNIRKAILLDISASMNRNNLWTAAIERTQSIINEAKPDHILSLYTFDSRVHSLLADSEAESLSDVERKTLLLSTVKAIQPSHLASNLGTALTTLADRLSGLENDPENSAQIASEIILVSDFQAGSALDRLENFQWPTNCHLSVERIRTKTGTQTDHSNVSAHALEGINSESMPIRLVHRNGEQTKSIELEWLDENGAPIESKPNDSATLETQLKRLPNQLKIDVPIETSLVVEMPKLINSAMMLELRGDSAAFDNRRWYAKPPRRELKIVCIDDSNRPTPESLGYFLRQLPLDNDVRQVTFTWRAPGSSDPWPDSQRVPLMVASHLLSVVDAQQARPMIENGGHFLWSLDASMSDSSSRESVMSAWKALTNGEPVEINEAISKKECLWEKIDFTHPLFQKLADSRFNDFTKIRFWQHRRLVLSPSTSWQTIASFDDGAPALACCSIGSGKLWLMAAGWQPAESQLALSSKFVPIIAGIFEDSLPIERDLTQLETGDQIAIEAGETWEGPSKELLLPIESADGLQRVEFASPGFYRVTKNRVSQTVAVNLPASESDTRVMELEKLERLGVATKAKLSEERLAVKEQQRKSIELEKDQRLWRWFMIGMLGVIVIETLWCSRG